MPVEKAAEKVVESIKETNDVEQEEDQIQDETIDKARPEAQAADSTGIPDETVSPVSNQNKLTEEKESVETEIDAKGEEILVTETEAKPDQKQQNIGD